MLDQISPSGVLDTLEVGLLSLHCIYAVVVLPCRTPVDPSTMVWRGLVRAPIVDFLGWPSYSGVRTSRKCVPFVFAADRSTSNRYANPCLPREGRLLALFFTSEQQYRKVYHIPYHGGGRPRPVDKYCVVGQGPSMALHVTRSPCL